MKNLYILLLAASAFIFGGCDEDYLEVSPTTDIASVDAFKNTTNAWAAINGIHRSLYIDYYGNQDQGGQGSNMIYVDMMGEDVVFTANAAWYVGTYRWIDPRDETDKVPYFNYRFYYTIISNANMIIDNVADAEGPQADKNAIKAQALSYRAWSYFQMIRLFGERFDATTDNNNPGIPLITNSTTSSAQPRASVAAIYEQINKDLDAAINLFNDGATERTNKSHLNLSVAQGLKARVALTQQNWQVAADMANAAREGYQLMSHAEYLSGFNDYTNPEWMWGSHQNAEQNTAYNSFFAYLAANFSSYSMRLNPKAINTDLYAQISDTDIRKQLWDPTGANPEFPIPRSSTGAALGVRKPYMTRKFLTSTEGISIGDVPIMRAAEMYLIEAEALARMDKFNEAADVLFELVSARDPEYVTSTNTGQDLIDEILIHRRVELWSEGFRFYDLKRLNQDMDRTGTNHQVSIASVMHVPAGDERWQWKIPQTEINIANGIVTQNP